MTEEYRTVNADLAAALVTIGARMRSLHTSDGVTVEFVFDSTMMDGDGYQNPLTAVVEQWSHSDLRVDASTMSKNIKRIYKQVRDKKREFENSR